MASNAMGEDAAGKELFEICLRKGESLGEDMMKTCFQVFDQDRDGVLNLREFSSLTRALFCDESGKPYPVEERKVERMFNIFDVNKNGSIDFDEFRVCWNDWIRQILSPVSCLIIVDVQNDFLTGSLALKNCPAKQDGEEVVAATNHLIDTIPYDLVVYTFDWHPANHVSFYDNLPSRKLHSSSQVTAEQAKMYDEVVFEGPPINEQVLWPAHCIQGSWGAELHPELKVVNNCLNIYKGTNPEIDSYSAFWDNKKLSETTLLQELKARNITDVYCCGVAYEFCVGSTACHALEHGFRTILVEDATRGVSNEGIANMRKKLIDNHGLIADSHQIKAMVMAKDRRPELGFKAALTLEAKFQQGL